MPCPQGREQVEAAGQRKTLHCAQTVPYFVSGCSYSQTVHKHRCISLHPNHNLLGKFPTETTRHNYYDYDLSSYILQGRPLNRMGGSVLGYLAEVKQKGCELTESTEGTRHTRRKTS